MHAAVRNAGRAVASDNYQSERRVRPAAESERAGKRPPRSIRGGRQTRSWISPTYDGRHVRGASDDDLP